MARTKERSAIDKVAATRHWLEMTASFPDMLTAPDVGKRMQEARESFAILLEFRNMVRFVSEFDEPPRAAANRYLDM